uniref:Prolamin_like domain-containing protein n=1 Tax=Heterorhabditis bacteriophora TaxID=37862 RepID=A0A1I7WRF1_HETBA
MPQSTSVEAPKLGCSTMTVIKNLVNSMPEQIFQVINRSGGCTDYQLIIMYIDCCCFFVINTYFNKVCYHFETHCS